MAAASYWSLLAPAIEMAEDSKLYGQNGEYSFLPVAVGFLLGALFVYGTDLLISSFGVHSPNLILGDSSTYKYRIWFIVLYPVHELDFFLFLAAFSSDSMFHKEKDDRNLRLLDNHHSETTETTIEGKCFSTLQLIIVCRVLLLNEIFGFWQLWILKLWCFGVSHLVVW